MKLKNINIGYAREKIKAGEIIAEVINGEIKLTNKIKYLPYGKKKLKRLALEYACAYYRVQNNIK